MFNWTELNSWIRDKRDQFLSLDAGSVSCQQSTWLEPDNLHNPNIPSLNWNHYSCSLVLVLYNEAIFIVPFLNELWDSFIISWISFSTVFINIHHVFNASISDSLPTPRKNLAKFLINLQFLCKLMFYALSSEQCWSVMIFIMSRWCPLHCGAKL